MDSDSTNQMPALDRTALLAGLPDPAIEEFELGSLQMAPDGPLPELELFTDGGCSPNPGPGAWAFILRPVGEKSGLEQAGATQHSTNNRMEMMAVIRGLLALDRPCRVHLVADSEYVVKGLTEWIDGWKRRGWVNSRRKPVLNEELWRVLDVLRGYHALEAKWTRGHAGHAENERCDALVNQVRARLR
jgi:ribonuclease HI